jgi:hypothetical protein
MTSETGVVAPIMNAIASVFGWVVERLHLNNTDAMRANAAARTESGIKDRAGAVVAKGDLAAVRKAVAE